MEDSLTISLVAFNTNAKLEAISFKRNFLRYSLSGTNRWLVLVQTGDFQRSFLPGFGLVNR